MFNFFVFLDINWISQAGKAKCIGRPSKAAGNPVSKAPGQFFQEGFYKSVP